MRANKVFFGKHIRLCPPAAWVFYLLDGVGVKQSYVYLHNPPDSFPSRLPAIVIGTYTQKETGSYYADLIKVKYVILDKENPIVIEGLDEPVPNCRVQ